jgi:pimeloyl-ACP methyl ester carboxylesterase
MMVDIMKSEHKKIILTVFIIILCVILLLFGVSYLSFSHDMDLAKERLSASEIFKTPHGDIEYAVQGEGMPILLLHGAGGGFDFGFWTGRIFFKNNYKIISVSRYGYLRSPVPDNASIRNQAALYNDLMDHLNITKVVVVGTSAGGPSAIQFANDYPGKCSELILISAVSGPEPQGSEEPVYIKIIHLIQQSDYAYWLFTRFGQSTILDLMGIPKDVYYNFTPEQKQFAQEMLDVMHPMTPRYKGTINDAEMLLVDKISVDNLTAPTLIIHARDDALVNYTHALNSHAMIKQSKLVLFDTGGHAMLSQIDHVRETTGRFLNMSGEGHGFVN